MIKNYENDESAFSARTVLMWYGTVQDIPQGWLVADGTNGTIPMQSKFVRGATDDSNVLQFSQSHLKTLRTVELPAHNHSGTTSVDGAHRHGFDVGGAWFGTSGSTIYYQSTYYEATATTSSGGQHRHDITAQYVGNSDPIDWRPPFTTILYIEKV